jgi:hypothetical protein
MNGEPGSQERPFALVPFGGEPEPGIGHRGRASPSLPPPPPPPAAGAGYGS